MHLSIFCPRGGAWGRGGDFEQGMWPLGGECGPWVSFMPQGGDFDLYRLFWLTVYFQEWGFWSIFHAPGWGFCPKFFFKSQNPHPRLTFPPGGAKYWQAHNMWQLHKVLTAVLTKFIHTRINFRDMNVQISGINVLEPLSVTQMCTVYHWNRKYWLELFSHGDCM